MLPSPIPISCPPFPHCCCGNLPGGVTCWDLSQLTRPSFSDSARSSLVPTSVHHRSALYPVGWPRSTEDRGPGLNLLFLCYTRHRSAGNEAHRGGPLQNTLPDGPSCSPPSPPPVPLLSLGPLCTGMVQALFPGRAGPQQRRSEGESGASLVTLTTNPSSPPGHLHSSALGLFKRCADVFLHNYYC